MSAPRSKPGPSRTVLLTLAVAWTLAAVVAITNLVLVLSDSDSDSRFLPLLIAVFAAVNAAVWGVKYLRRRREDTAPAGAADLPRASGLG